MVRVFTTNKKGNIELSKDELKELLDNAYWEGYHANHTWVYSTPSTISNATPSTYSPYSWTLADGSVTYCSNISNAESDM